MTVAIFGAAGAMGSSVAAALRHRGVSCRVVGRNRARLADVFREPSGIQIWPADLSDPEQATKAASGCDAVVYTLGLPYNEFRAFPDLARTTVGAVTRARVSKLILITNIYAYGLPRTERVSEDHPREPTTFKGKMRKEQEDILLSAHGEAGLKVLSLRLPDFFGPEAKLSLVWSIFEAAASGKTANVVGPIDTPHEFVFTPDVGPIVADLLVREEAFGRGYNLAGSGIITQRELAKMAFQTAGTTLKLRVAGRGMLRLLGLFNPIMHELVEMQYLQTHPVLLDESRLSSVLGLLKKTSYPDGVNQTIATLRGLTDRPR